MPSSGFLLQAICFFSLFTRNNVEVTREIKSCQCSTGNSRELFQQTPWCLAMVSILSLKPKDPVQGHTCIGLLCPFASPQWLHTASSSSASLKSFFSWLWRDCVFGGLSPEWHSAFLTATPTSSPCCHFALKWCSHWLLPKRHFFSLGN